MNWAKFHSDICNTGFNPNEFILSPATVGDLELKWKYTTQSSVFNSSAAVVNGAVYVGSADNNVYSLNARDGSIKWKHTTGFLVNSSPAVVNGSCVTSAPMTKTYMP